MCGIIGYIGHRHAVSVILDGLKRLEYRGYDSAGIAVVVNNELQLRRCVGKIVKLEEILEKETLSSHQGLGHTRWATHGRPCEENAHPHTDCKGEIVIVHNGIIENYLTLREKLKKEGHTFKSETDTEVLVHLIEQYFPKTEKLKPHQLLSAVEKALKEVEGSYALGVISGKLPGVIIAARQDSPLIVGLGEPVSPTGGKENFIASDVPAILPYTNKVIYLENEEVALVTQENVEVFNKQGKEVKKTIQYISWDPVTAEKSGYKHFMLKEIHEQPQVIQDTFRGRMFPDKGEISFEDLSLAEYKEIKKVSIIACGTSYHAGLVGKFLLENLAGLPCEVDIGSEFRYRQPIIDSQTLALVISQSGETADTLAGLRIAKTKKAKTLAICNVMGSSAAREAEKVIYTRCGPEIGVASTKAFTGQLTVLYLLSLALGLERKELPLGLVKRIMSHLLLIPGQAEDILANQETLLSLSSEFFEKRDFLYLGRNINYPIALEGALKLKEISYIHAEGYPAGEMKHGPIALIDREMPVVVIATKSSVYGKILSNIEEAKAREGIVIALATEGDKKIKDKVDRVIYLPENLEILSPIVNVIPLQLFAYHIAVKRGCDVDQPRNLAKSVTVE
jgi:glucosamine--fructose-6-phosphate aminotransferase (isomerizing)